MALNKPALIAGLVALQTDMETKYIDSKQAYAESLADLIDAFVKSGKVQPGIPVQTQGSATSQAGATIAEGTIL